MSRRKSLRSLFSGSSVTASDITPAPDIEWTPIGPASEHLMHELENLYWEGVRAELENIVRTLRAWQSQELSGVVLRDESDSNVHGYDTFLDQVSHESRKFAIAYGKEKEEKEKRDSSRLQEPQSYQDSLRDHLKSRKNEILSSFVKGSVRETLKQIPRLSGIQQRTWMLLQASGFLDMDKLIEHRPPLEKLGFWKRPAIPQLKLSKFDEFSIPRFEPLHCMRLECHDVIRGSMFVHSDLSQDKAGVICEDCYRHNFYGKASYVKSYKHCILGESMTPAVSRKICYCKSVSHFDGTGKPLSLFPVDKKLKHIDAAGIGSMQCSLLKLGEHVAWAKYKGLQSIVGIDKPTLHSKLPFRSTSIKQKESAEGQKKELKKVASWKPRNLRMVSESTMYDAKDRTATSSTTSVATEAQADEDIPLFFRRFAEKYPFGNVHMALRVGPLVIENGVAQTHGGAFISLRETPVYHERFNLAFKPNRNFTVGGSEERQLWKGSPRNAIPKRYKAMMKQVAGVPFSGALPRNVELQIVEDLLSASRKPFDEPGLPLSDQLNLLNSGIEPALAKLKSLIKEHLRTYMQSISERLAAPTTKIKWSIQDNNCQSFCNNLIDRKLFEPLLNGPETNKTPLYIMSFVCPDEGYLQRGVKSKFDVPNGLTEEYLLRFHFGRHDEADIIDTCQEYWYDWGAFGGPLYSYQDLYPWDCTEAYGRYPTRCGSCNLSKHVWAFPFDSWSMSSLHLSRDRYVYAPATVAKGITATGPRASPQSWMRNRLTVITAVSILHRAAAAMARSESFCNATRWLHEDGLRRNNPALARVKLGGIHRAQPFSHYFEAGTYNHYFLAPWAIWSRQEQINAYELLRDGRVKLPDVLPRTRDRFGGRGAESDGWDYFSGFESTSRDMADSGFNEGPNTPRRLNIGSAFADAGFPNDERGTDSSGHGPACAVGESTNCDSGNCGSSVCAAGPECGGSRQGAGGDGGNGGGGGTSYGDSGGDYDGGDGYDGGGGDYGGMD